MAESQRLRLGDVRMIFRLVGECRDLGADPVAWRSHLLGRLCGWLGAKVGAGGEALGIERGEFIPTTVVDVGWENADERQAMFESMEYQASRGVRTGLFPAIPPVTNGGVIAARSDVVGDREWYASIQFCDYLRRSGVDDLMVSFQQIGAAAERFCALSLFRALGERKFSGREKAFLAELHQELAPLVGRQLAADHEPSAMQLSTRLRHVLDCLLEGDSEKQVAARLGLSRQTVHQYVKAVYRHFRVNSRAELMARWIRFRYKLSPRGTAATP